MDDDEESLHDDDDYEDDDEDADSMDYSIHEEEEDEMDRSNATPGESSAADTEGDDDDITDLSIVTEDNEEETSGVTEPSVTPSNASIAKSVDPGGVGDLFGELSESDGEEDEVEIRAAEGDRKAYTKVDIECIDIALKVLRKRKEIAEVELALQEKKVTTGI